jgi:hypothetical protein
MALRQALEPRNRPGILGTGLLRERAIRAVMPRSQTPPIGAPNALGGAQVPTGAGAPAGRGALRGSGPLLALLALVLAFALADARFATLANLRVILDSAAVPFVLAVGMTFVIRLGSIDLSVEGLMAACSLAFALVIANDRTHVDLGWLGLPVAAALGCAFGLANGLVVTWLRVPSFVATLGVGAICLGLAMLWSGDQAPLIRDALMRRTQPCRGGGRVSGRRDFRRAVHTAGPVHLRYRRC